MTINWDEPGTVIEEFIKRENLAFTTLLEEHHMIIVRYQDWPLPTIFLIDGGGNIRRKVIGYRNWCREPPESSILLAAGV